MHQGEINPSLEKKKSPGWRAAAKSSLRRAGTRRGFCLPLRTSPSRRHQEVQRDRHHPPRAGSFLSTAQRGDVSIRMQPWSVRLQGQALEQVGPGQCGKHHGHPRNTQNTANNNSTFSWGRTNSTWKNHFSWKNSSEVLLEWSHPWGGFTHVDSLLWGEVRVSRHEQFPPEILAPQETPIAQGSCQRVWAEAETMGLAWELLWFLQH